MIWVWLAVIGMTALITLSVIEMVIKYKRANDRTAVIMVDDDEERRARYLEMVNYDGYVVKRCDGY